MGAVACRIAPQLRHFLPIGLGVPRWHHGWFDRKRHYVRFPLLVRTRLLLRNHAGGIVPSAPLHFHNGWKNRTAANALEGKQLWELLASYTMFNLTEHWRSRILFITWMHTRQWLICCSWKLRMKLETANHRFCSFCSATSNHKKFQAEWPQRYEKMIKDYMPHCNAFENVLDITKRSISAPKHHHLCITRAETQNERFLLG